MQGERVVAVLPRRTAFVRTAAGRGSVAQVVAALLVDTPGMRELALPGGAGLDAAAIGDGVLDPARLTAWRKLQAEAYRQELRADARARALEHARLRARPRSGHRRELASGGEHGVLRR
ncbi:hypothetical protein [Modestobacter lapidis]